MINECIASINGRILLYNGNIGYVIYEDEMDVSFVKWWIHACNFHICSGHILFESNLELSIQTDELFSSGNMI